MRPDQAIEAVFREEHGRVVASLVRRFGDLDVAEDAAGEAVVAALEHWRADGVPANPGGWLMTTATRRAIDRLRRESRRGDLHRAAGLVRDDTPHELTGVVVDDRLRLVFTCCHPALAPEVRVALTLRLLGGLTVAEVAQAFLVPETTMAQRITRGKRKISAAHIPFRVPGPEDLQARLRDVLAVVYLVFNEGYLTSGGSAPLRVDLTTEAVRLGRLLRGLLPREHEVTGLLALMLLTEARRDARVADGELVVLPEQDRTRWDHDLLAEGHALVRACLAHGRPGPYQVQAAINAVHTDPATPDGPDWSQVLALYDQLLVLSPGPVVRLNRAVALAELAGAAVALAEVDRLPLDGYHPWHATRADLLRRLGRDDEAGAAYDAALGLAGNPAERAYLTRQRARLPG